MRCDSTAPLCRCCLLLRYVIYPNLEKQEDVRVAIETAKDLTGPEHS